MVDVDPASHGLIGSVAAVPDDPVGAGVQPGTSKHIAWNAGTDAPDRMPVYTVGGAVYRTSRHDEVAVSAGADGYRWHFSAEWEYAARGGRQSQGYTFSGSDDVDAVA